MNAVKLTYEELSQRVDELNQVLDAMRDGNVDSIISGSHLLVLRDHELELLKEHQSAELRAILESVPTALAIVLPGGEIYVANKAFCDVSCISLGNCSSCSVSCPSRCTSLEQWTARLHVHGKFAEELKQHLTESFEEQQQPISVEITFKTLAGIQHHWLITFQQFAGDIDGQAAVIIAGTDMTEKKRLINQLSDAKDQMEGFMAAAAHDLKAPLITIAHNVTFARMGQADTLTAETAECLDRIQSAEKNMMDLLTQISEVSRAGRDTEPHELHSFRELAQASLSQLEGTLSKRRAEVVIGDDLPELYCQGTKFIQVFSNLISNAVKYTPAEQTPYVEIGYQGHVGEEHTFFVRDNGCGIPEDCRQRIFGLFDRLCTDPEITGQGVGLTIVKRIVELHGGRVWAESTEGKGSTFYFTIGRQRRDDNVCDI